MRPGDVSVLLVPPPVPAPGKLCRPRGRHRLRPQQGLSAHPILTVADHRFTRYPLTHVTTHLSDDLRMLRDTCHAAKASSARVLQQPHQPIMRGAVDDRWPCRVADHRQNFLPILQNCGPLLRVRVRERGERACADVARLLLRNGLELDHLRSGKCDAQHLGSEVHEHCRIAVLGADHGTEAVPIMADSITDGVARHNCDGLRLVERTSWEGPRVAGAGRSHASSARPVGRAGAPLPEVAGRTSGVQRRVRCGLQSGSSHPINTDGEISGSPVRVRHGRPNGGNVGFDPNGPIFCYFSNIAAASGCCQKTK